MCVFEWRCPVKRQRNSSMSESKAEWCRLASDGSEAVDWLSTNRSSGVVAGQHELGQALDHVAQSGAVHVRVALDGYGRKVAVCSGGWREELVKDAFDLRGGLMMELSVLYNFLLLIFIARLLVHSHRGHHFGLQSIGSYLTFLIFFFQICCWLQHCYTTSNCHWHSKKRAWKETATGFATSHCQSVGHKIGREKL